MCARREQSIPQALRRWIGGRNPWRQHREHDQHHGDGESPAAEPAAAQKLAKWRCAVHRLTAPRITFLASMTRIIAAALWDQPWRKPDRSAGLQRRRTAR